MPEEPKVSDTQTPTQDKRIWEKIEEWAEANPKKTITIIATVVSAIFPKAQVIASQILDIIGSTITP